jgi:hypothetical protein
MREKEREVERNRRKTEVVSRNKTHQIRYCIHLL